MDDARKLLCVELTVHFVRLFYIDGHHLGRNRCPLYGIAGWLLFRIFSIAAMEMQLGLR